MTRAVLTINAGSSSIKFALFEIGGPQQIITVSDGEIEGIGTAPHFFAKDTSGALLAEQRWPQKGGQTHEVLLGHLLHWVDSHLGQETLAAVGHRVVHGGTTHYKPERATNELLDQLAALTPLAPLHQPHNLAPIRAIAAERPGLPQVACFDTGFHHGMSAVATRLALPREYEADGVRRYGFHGLSYEFIARRLRDLAPDLAAGRVIAAHLGNGASLCAMDDGHSVDTTMGFTALDGLMMGTRCGSIDPGAVLYLIQQHGMTAAQVEDVLYHRSGLLGVSDIGSDMRSLLHSPDPHAREAIDLFVFRIAREVGALVSTMGGLNGVVFTAGIGEHAPEIRAAVCQRLAWLGVTLDEAANALPIGRISAPESRIDVWVIPTNEEAMIARHTIDTVGLGTKRQASGDNHKHQEKIMSERPVAAPMVPQTLQGKGGLVVGIANDHSIAAGCAEAFAAAGARLAATYLNAKAEPYVRPVTDRLGCELVVPCDVRIDGQLEAVFDRIRSEWGELDFLLHSIAYAPKDDLHCRITDCSQAGFNMAMDVSCHSFIRMARMAEPLMPRGGCLLTVTFYGSEKVVEEYNLMGPVKAALESSVRYMAAELGPKRIRVHALSPGPLKTRAASGIDRFDELLERTRARTPEHQLVSIGDVGNTAAFLVSDAAAALTGNIEYIDGGYHILG